MRNKNGNGEKDREILRCLNANARMSLKEIARKVNLPVTTLFDKIKRLEKKGIIKKYTIEVDAESVEKPISAYVLVSLRNSEEKKSQKETAEKISKLPEVQEVYLISGEWTILLKIRCKDNKEVADFIIEKLREFNEVDKTLMYNILVPVKEHTVIEI